MRWNEQIEWHEVYETTSEYISTYVAKVPGGVLYRHRDCTGDCELAETMVFVPIGRLS